MGSTSLKGENMQSSDISAEVESTLVTLAGNWAKEWADEDINVVEVDKWEEVFTNRFNIYYTILFRALSQAREHAAKNATINRKL
jgi:hypothetical protein